MLIHKIEYTEKQWEMIPKIAAELGITCDKEIGTPFIKRLILCGEKDFEAIIELCNESKDTDTPEEEIC